MQETAVASPGGQPVVNDNMIQGLALGVDAEVSERTGHVRLCC